MLKTIETHPVVRTLAAINNDVNAVKKGIVFFKVRMYTKGRASWL